ncbi:MAG: hypothetical protein ACT4PO_09935 [Actinomycetota bacterium]
MTRWKFLALALGLVAISGGCARDGPEPRGTAGVFFPTYPPSGDSALGILQGVLIARDGCLFVETPYDQQFLLLWPEGYAAISEDGRIRVLDQSGDSIGAVGDDLTLVGGERGLRSAADTVGEEIPQECQRGFYWVVVPE